MREHNGGLLQPPVSMKRHSARSATTSPPHELAPSCRRPSQPQLGRSRSPRHGRCQTGRKPHPEWVKLGGHGPRTTHVRRGSTVCCNARLERIGNAKCVNAGSLAESAKTGGCMTWFSVVTSADRCDPSRDQTKRYLHARHGTENPTPCMRTPIPPPPPTHNHTYSSLSPSFPLPLGSYTHTHTCVRLPNAKQGRPPSWRRASSQAKPVRRPAPSRSSTRRWARPGGGEGSKRPVGTAFGCLGDARKQSQTWRVLAGVRAKGSSDHAVLHSCEPSAQTIPVLFVVIRDFAREFKYRRVSAPPRRAMSASPSAPPAARRPRRFTHSSAPCCVFARSTHLVLCAMGMGERCVASVGMLQGEQHVIYDGDSLPTALVCPRLVSIYCTTFLFIPSVAS